MFRLVKIQFKKTVYSFNKQNQKYMHNYLKIKSQREKERDRKTEREREGKSKLYFIKILIDLYIQIIKYIYTNKFRIMQL